MFARVTTLEAQPDQADTIISQIKDRMVPALREMKGFKGAYFLENGTRTKGISISLWDTEEDLNASFNTIIPIRDAISKALGMGSAPTPEVYEVSREGISGMRKAA